MKTRLNALRADSPANLRRFEQRLALRIVTIVAIANGIPFAELRFLPLAA